VNDAPPLKGCHIAGFAGLIAGLISIASVFVSCRTPTAPKQILKVDSREASKVAEPDKSCKLSGLRTLLTDSELIVLDDGAVQYRTSVGKLCLGERPETLPDHRWGFRWANSEQQSFQTRLDRSELDGLKSLLDRDEVKRLEGYANAGPAVGDFEIEVSRPESPQKVYVLGFRPYSWTQRDAPLSELICEAKTIAQRASKTAALPDWCKFPPQN
jgi:hypothetical protein